MRVPLPDYQVLRASPAAASWATQSVSRTSLKDDVGAGSHVKAYILKKYAELAINLRRGFTFLRQ